jgi:DNA-binding response OmpR family regulator
LSAEVLIVDDDAAILRMLQRTLSAEGYEVTTAGDGGNALAAIERTTPDLVVLDLGLPDLDGLAVCRRLRDKGLAPPALARRLREYSRRSEAAVSVPRRYRRLLLPLRGGRGGSSA